MFELLTQEEIELCTPEVVKAIRRDSRNCEGLCLVALADGVIVGYWSAGSYARFEEFDLDGVAQYPVLYTSVKTAMAGQRMRNAGRGDDMTWELGWWVNDDYALNDGGCGSYFGRTLKRRFPGSPRG